MEIKAFLIRFEKSLISNGFSPDTARHHTLKVAKGLTDSDKRRILAMTEDAQAEAVAQSYFARIRKRSEVYSDASNEMANTTTISNNFRGSMPEETEDVETVAVYRPKKKVNTEPEEIDVKVRPRKESKEDFSDDGGATRQFSHVGKTRRAESEETGGENVKTMKIDVVKIKSKGEFSEEDSAGKTKTISKVNPAKVKLSPEARKEYTKELLKRSPLFVLGFAGAGIGAFIVYALIALLIAAFIALLIGVVVVGGVGTLAGLIYGIIKIFSVAPEGLYEIGFALVIAGGTMILSICSYNVAVRAIPVLWRNFTYFLTDCMNKFKTYIRRIRKECADK